MAGAFKTIANRNVTKHTAHKSYVITMVDSSGSFDDLQVFAYRGIQNLLEWSTDNNILTTNGYAKRDIYDSTYSNFYYSGSNAFTGLLSKEPEGSLMVKAHCTDMNVMSIPKLMMGDRIKPGSVKITSGSNVLLDDGNGNLKYDTAIIGNIFYDYGIITNTGLPGSFSSYFSDGVLEFKNTYVMQEHEYMCSIGKEEFNASSNVSVLSDIATKTLKTFTSTPEWSPYITTIGLYDQDNNLLAIGKLGQAIKKSEKYDTSFIIRFYT
jgi:hypothetical protein